MGQEPRVSVVVPCLNEAPCVEGFVRAVRETGLEGVGGAGDGA